MSMLMRLAATSSPAGHAYATLDPATLFSYSGGTDSLSNGNLTCTLNVYCSVKSTLSKSSGKWSWEVHYDSTTGPAYYQASIATAAASSLSGFGGVDALGYGYVAVNGDMRNNGVDNAYGAVCTTGDRIRMEMDCDNHTLECFKNNVSQGKFTVSSLTFLAAQAVVSTATCVVTYNFGATPFVDPPTAGFNVGLYL